MVDNGKFTLGEPRWHGATLPAAHRLVRSPMKQFSQHLAGAESAEQYQYGGSARLEQLTKSARYRYQVDDTIEWREVRERAIEEPSTGRVMTSGKILQILSGYDFSTRDKWRQFGLCQFNHCGRRVGQKHFVAGLCEKRGVFACAPSKLKDMTALREFPQEYLADGASLCRHTTPCAESLIKDRGNRVKCRRGGPHRLRHCASSIMRGQRCDSNAQQIPSKIRKRIGSRVN